MKCPIDATELVTSERHGVAIDHCPKCRGVWLDRGELDKIIDKAVPPIVPQEPRRAPPPPVQEYREPYRGDAPQEYREPYREKKREREREDRRDEKERERGRKDRRYSAKYSKPKRLKSFLEEIFDFD